MATCMANGDGGSCESCKRIEDIDVRIVQVEKHLVSLKAARVALKTARNASHDRLVARLPLEIVSQIFRFFVDAEFDNEGPDDNGDFPPFLDEWMDDAPLRLGAVCHAWRAIAWASPGLWIKISVNVLRKGRESIPDLASQWLERTGQLPLTICLYEAIDGESVTDTNKAVVISLMHTLCKFYSRCRTLSISLRGSDQHIDDDHTTRFWGPDINGRNNLQHLELKNLSPKFAAQLFKTFHRKPSPTYVSWSNIRLDCLDIDWSNATAIDVNHLTFQESIQIFRACVRLRTFKLISLPHPAGPAPMPMQSLSSPIIIPTLLSLCLSPLSTSNILDCLTLPLLEEFEWDSDGAFDSLISLVGRSHCRLVSLRISRSDITDEFLLFLQATPSLKSLTICDYLGGGNSECLLKYLATSDESIYLPHLETLQFAIYRRRIFQWETIPDIFDPGRLYIGDNLARATTPHLQRRSLRFLLTIVGSLDEIGYIDVVSLDHISALREDQIDIAIDFKGEDFIATSMDFHCSDESSTDYESD